MTDSLTESNAVVRPARDPRLTNEDLAPLPEQRWRAYNFFAFWMSDVHSVGGYVTAGSLFALGLAAWQVLVATAVGATIAMLVVLLGSADAAAFSWFIGAGLAFVLHWGLSRRTERA